MEVSRGNKAHCNKLYGFAATFGGHMRIEGGADASANECSGFLAQNPCSCLETGPGCSSHNNKCHGFLANKAGQLVVGTNSEARLNGDWGVKSSDKGSLVKLSAGFIASDNGSDSSEPAFCEAHNGRISFPGNERANVSVANPPHLLQIQAHLLHWQ
jgi:hypothetical protein